MAFEYDFIRYLKAKKTVDDRALNKDVWATFKQQLPARPDIIEVGAGIGTMIERCIEQGFIQGGSYTAVDKQPQNITFAQQRWQQQPLPFSLRWEAIDLFQFAAREAGQPTWDALIAHAFLDLMNIPDTLPILFSLLKPGGLFYFSINFDGLTSLEPLIDPPFDALVEQLYHQTMDTRLTNDKSSGDSRSGRHLFQHLRQAGADILAAGGSDWVVFAGPDGYPADEAYFLHFIIHTVYLALKGNPALDATRFAAWVRQRHAQIATGELVYVAHQLDFLGRSPGNAI